MPKQTFFNLSEEKRNNLLAIATKEFAENDYSAASISRIVERSGIAKGSIYQYFDDKQEMFVYLVEEAGKRLLDEMTVDITGDITAGNTASADVDFFSYLRRQMSDTIRVNLANPQFSRLLLRSTQAPTDVRQAVMQRLSIISGNHLLQLVQHGIERGDLRAELDPALMTVMLNVLFSELGKYIAGKLGVDMNSIAAIEVSTFDVPMVEQIYDSVIDVLRCGMGSGETGRLGE